MADTIFYSWQSDLPNATNRGFIEKALLLAIKEIGQEQEELYEAPREIELDKDTKGVSGSPPITETIFGKIEECSVFVVDLSFVGSTDEGRAIPNPNVLIEYGWALAKAGHNRIITVMNCAFGEPTETSLPFDLRHHTWPIRYTLPENPDQETRERERQNLTSTLTHKIGEILHSEGEKSATHNEMALTPKDRASSFLRDGDVLCRVRDNMGFGDSSPATSIVWQDSPQIFIRVIPDTATPRKQHAELMELVQANQIPLLGRNYGQNREGNEFGVVLFELHGGDEPQTSANRIVQVTQFGEIWAIDGMSLTVGDGVIPFLEHELAQNLGSYMTFMRDSLGVTSRVTIIAGLSGIAGMEMWRAPLAAGRRYTDFGQRYGNAVSDEFSFEIPGVSLNLPDEVGLEYHEHTPYVIDDPAVAYAYKILVPFYEELYSQIQFKRPDSLPR